MKSIIPLLLLLLFVFSSTLSFSQNSISYTYDANGNRIIRRILDMTMENLESTDTTNYEEEILEEKLTIEEEIGEAKISFFPNPVKQWLNSSFALKFKMVIYNYFVYLLIYLKRQNYQSN